MGLPKWALNCVVLYMNQLLHRNTKVASKYKGPKKFEVPDKKIFGPPYFETALQSFIIHWLDA